MEDKLFKEIDKHILNDEQPSKYIKENIHKLKGSKLEIIRELEKVEQNPVHHPEGNVLNHTLLVLDAAAMVRKFAYDKRALMWAALFHDVGKKKATKVRKGKITAYEHDRYGEDYVKALLENYQFLEEDFKRKVSGLVGYHMHSLYISRNLPFGNSEKMIKNVEMHDMALLFFADKLGKGDKKKETIKRVINEVEEILKKLENQYDLDMNYTIKSFEELYKSL